MTTNITINDDCCNSSANLKYYSPGFNGEDFTPILLKDSPAIVYTVTFAGNDTLVEIFDANTTAGLSPDNSDTNYILAWGGGTGHWNFGEGIPLTYGLVVKTPVANVAGEWVLVTYR